MITDTQPEKRPRQETYTWITKLPFKMRFSGYGGLYYSRSFATAGGACCTGYLAAIMGVAAALSWCRDDLICWGCRTKSLSARRCSDHLCRRRLPQIVTCHHPTIYVISCWRAVLNRRASRRTSSAPPLGQARAESCAFLIATFWMLIVCGKLALDMLFATAELYSSVFKSMIQLAWLLIACSISDLPSRSLRSPKRQSFGAEPSDSIIYSRQT